MWSWQVTACDTIGFWYIGWNERFPVPVQVSCTTSKPEEKVSRHTKMNGVAPNVDRNPQETLIKVPTADTLRK